MEMEVTMDKFGRIMIPKKMRDSVKAEKFTAKVHRGTLVLKPIPSFWDLLGKFPEIDMEAFRKQHDEDKGKDD